MDFFNFDNLSSSINAQLNHGIQVANKGNSHLQTGKKINEAKDDVGAFSVNAKINSELKQKTQRVQNLQNSLSFLQVQDGALKFAGNILSRMGELKTQFEAPTFNGSDKEIFDEEFKELQIQLKKIRDSKFNGVSLFCSADDKNLTEKSQNQFNLKASSGNVEGEIILNRAGFMGAMKIVQNFPSQTSNSKASGNSAESRTTINLLGPSGTLTWKQNPYTVPDHFKAVHGSEVLHEAVYGTHYKNKKTLELYDSPAQTGTRKLPVTSPAGYGERVDVIDFGKTGNSSKTLELIVNEFGQTSTGTKWNASYKIEYDPYEQDLLDDSVVWSLSDFQSQDFDSCLANLAGARAENGATQQRINSEISELQSSMLGIEQHMEKSDGLDIARAVGELNAVRTRLTMNANLMKSAQEMENKLFTDFL